MSFHIARYNKQLILSFNLFILLIKYQERFSKLPPSQFIIQFNPNSILYIIYYLLTIFYLVISRSNCSKYYPGLEIDIIHPLTAFHKHYYYLGLI